MSVPAQGPITLYAPKRNLPIEVPARIIGKKHFHFRSKLKVILPVLLFSGLIGGIYPFVDDVRAVLTQGGSAVTLDAVLDENFNLSLAGNLEGSQLISTTTDSVPLVVNSTELVDDLNADLLDGQHGSYYLDSLGSPWTDAGSFLYPTGGEVLGDPSGSSSKIAGIYLGDSSPLKFGTSGVSFSQSASTLSVTQGNNKINFDSSTLIIDGANDRVGIGVAPESMFHLRYEDNAGSQTSLKAGLFELNLNANDADPFTSYYTAVQGRSRYYGSDTGGFPEDIGHVRGVFGSAFNYGTGTLYASAGVEGSSFVASSGDITEASGVTGVAGITPGSSGSIDRAIAFYTPGIQNSSTGTINEAYGLLVGGLDGGGAVNNNDGIFIENPACAGCTNIWSLYSEAGDNYFGGNVEVGDVLTINELIKTTNTDANAINMYNNGVSLDSYLNLAINLDNDDNDSDEAFVIATNGGSTELLRVEENQLVSTPPIFSTDGLFAGTATGTLGYLSAMEDYGADGLVRLVDTNTDDDSGYQVLRIGVGTDSSGTDTRFISFYADATDEADGTGVGNIHLNDGDVVYDTGGADYAEHVAVSQSVSQGDLISLTSSLGKKASSGERVIGVVSDTAGFVGNSDYERADEGGAIVGFLGQIKTKVAGDIKPGDQIAASEIPGVGTKATEKGPIVGIALQSHSGSEVSKIKVFVNPGWWDPGTVIASGGGIPGDLKVDSVEATKGVFDKLTSAVSAVIESLSVKVAEIASAVIENLKVKFLTIGESSTPTGITIYDRATGEPYCVSVVDGEVATEAGICE